MLANATCAAVSVAAAGLMAATSFPAPSGASVPSVVLGGSLHVKRIINGLWQTSSPAWGAPPPAAARVDAMAAMFAKGFSAFDGADHYGEAESLMGALSDRLRAEGAPEGAASMLTKWCPQPGPVSRAAADSAVNKSLARMRTTRLDSLQLHWWDYSQRENMLDCIRHLDAIRKEGRIANIALTNFDTEHVKLFVEREGIPIASNQVQFSVVDSRPLRKMVPYCEAHGVKLLTYGSLMGGLLSDAWLGRPAPSSRADVATPSLAKYYQMTQSFGSWQLFQEMLRTLRGIADRHSTGGAAPGAAPYTIANVAVAWVLAQPAVGGVIVGLRAGLSEHADDNLRALEIKLSERDLAEVAAVQAKGADLFAAIGDCGDEYRG
jgi:aryl-alcohol dehydrogenase-like predicted oxidoreductase